jgi:hypothetical protein
MNPVPLPTTLSAMRSRLLKEEPDRPRPRCGRGGSVLNPPSASKSNQAGTSDQLQLARGEECNKFLLHSHLLKVLHPPALQLSERKPNGKFNFKKWR